MDASFFTQKNVADCTASDILAADVFNENGCMLLASNAIITDYIKRHLILNRVDTILVCNRFDSDCPDDQLRANAINSYTETVSDVKKIITNLSAGKPLHYDAIVNIADNMVKDTDIRRSAYVVKYTSQLKSADQYTYLHSVNVAFYSMLIAKWLGLSSQEITFATQAGLLHDIGKTKIPDRILKKAGRLTTDEFATMKTHPLLSYKLLNDCPGINSQIKEAALLHHERLNGSGYPLGLSEVSIFSRIIAIADVYDAMTSDRVYKKGVTPFRAFDYFLGEGTSLFDKHILNVFIANISSLLIGSHVRMSTGETAEIVYIPPEDPSNPVLFINQEYVKLPADNDLDIEQIISE